MTCSIYGQWESGFNNLSGKWTERVIAMEYVMDTLRTFKTKNFRVVVDALPEDDLDLSWDESGDTLIDLESGKLIAFVARARVFFQGEEIAKDYLGGCIYKSFEDFMDHRACGRMNKEQEAKGESGRCGSYFSDMIHEVCSQARKYLNQAQAVKVRRTAE
jgi:hypothetical protein